MKILLRHVPSTESETVSLAAVPREGDEIHWADRILVVRKVIWFEQDSDEKFAACLYVTGG